MAAAPAELAGTRDRVHRDAAAAAAAAAAGTRHGEIALEQQADPAARSHATCPGRIRGVSTLGVLAALEERLRERRGDPDHRLCPFFDLIGGTSTRAIVATGLARGMAGAEIAGFYGRFGSVAFERRRLWQTWRSLYGDGGLVTTLQDTFGADTDLRPEHLRCLLTVVTRNATTDSAWPISSTPAARYTAPSRRDCDLRSPLWQLVRASTAAPVFSPPEVDSWDPDDPDESFVFVGGGTTAYDDPAFLSFRMATEPADRRCSHGGITDRELHDLIPIDPRVQDTPLRLDVHTGKAFRYARYDAEPTDAGLAELGLGGLAAHQLRKTDEVANLPDLETAGQALGERVSLAHLGSFAS
ncbi:patatin-like phospholipase family protein [Geodermatophilus sp. SYSU D00710]